ncbi:MAG TPA: DUF4149 domain-containing protein [Gammaproteobacteria bacterium]|jgi:hypothetical protein
MLRYAEQLLLTLWVGSLWAIGYLAVPILFATLDERMVAGMLAGRMFTAVSFIGLGCGAALLAMTIAAGSRALREPRVIVLVLMLALVAVGEFVLQPMMAELKLQGLVEGSAAAARFGMLHGIASLLYLVNSVCGLVLLLLAARRLPGLRAGG